MLAKASVFGFAAIAASLFATGAEAGQYEFLAAPAYDEQAGPHLGRGLTTLVSSRGQA